MFSSRLLSLSLLDILHFGQRGEVQILELRPRAVPFLFLRVRCVDLLLSQMNWDDALWCVGDDFDEILQGCPVSGGIVTSLGFTKKTHTMFSKTHFARRLSALRHCHS